MLSTLVLERVGAIRQQAVCDFSMRATLIERLNLSHTLMVASERLLSEAAREAEGALRNYYLNHLEEEKGHAQWLERDLGSVSPVRRAQEVAGCQYYLIKHVHPCCLLGYMAVLECFPAPLSFVQELERLHGKEICRTLRHHCENDPQHRVDLLDIIDKMNRPEILDNAVQTAIALSGI